jgi:8-oxo-dGTP pyrophosphatase MutT (NUDIX family)
MVYNNIMNTIHHITAGAIIYNLDLESIYLIHKKSRDEYALPKGHIEDGETDFDCAKRECLEETGLSGIMFISSNPCFTDTFTFDKDDTHNIKTVSFYSAIALDPKSKITKEMQDEDLEIVLVEKEKAIDLLSFPNLKEAVKKSYDEVRTHYANQ